ncbi:YdbL family protein [Caenispirillum bisanense]|uniref:YdbL family protein n=1 Tax=Caenispirillum bisanense TaxID=414052 RepID=UPI0031D8C4E2
MLHRLRRTAAVALLGLGCALAAVGPAAALDLDQARAQGLVGERFDGLLAPVQGGGEAEALAARINAQRMEEYRRIAEQRGVPVSEVQKLAGQSLINKVPPGTFVMTPAGQWQQK